MTSRTQISASEFYGFKIAERGLASPASGGDNVAPTQEDSNVMIGYSPTVVGDTFIIERSDELVEEEYQEA